MSNKLSLRIVYILMIIYSIYDILNSASAGNATDNRGKVYIFLFAVIAMLSLCCFTNRFLPKMSILSSLIIFVIYYIVDTAVIKGDTSWNFIVYTGLSVWWILSVWFFFNIISKNITSIVSVQNFIRIMFVLFSLGIAYGAINITNNYSVSYARVGYIYHLLAMIPFVLMERNNKVKNVFLIIAIALTIFSFKRGAIIILPCMLLAYFFFDRNIEQRKKNILRLIIIIIVIGLVWYAIDRYSGGYLSSRFTSSELMDGSGRSDIWRAALSNISMRNLFQVMFGIRSAGEQALWTGIHNEWISYLNANGIIGLILFGCIVFAIMIQAVRLVQRKSILAGPYMALITYILGVCWISGFFHVHSTFYVMAFLGTTQGLLLYDNERILEVLEQR